MILYNSTVEGATVTYVFKHTQQLAGHVSLCIETNVTFVCNNEGIWESDTDDVCTIIPGIYIYNVILPLH